MSSQEPPSPPDDAPKEQEPQETKRIWQNGRFREGSTQPEMSESRRVVPTVYGPKGTFAFDSMEAVVGVVVGVALAILWLFVFSRDRSPYDPFIRVCGFIWGALAAFTFGFLLVTWLIYAVIAAILMAIPGAIVAGLIGAIFGGSSGLRSGAAIGALIFGVGGFLSGLFAMGGGSSPAEREEFKQGIRDLPRTLYRFLKKVVKG